MEMYTSRDVATRLRVSIRTAQRLMKTVPHINAGIGKKRQNLRITKESFDLLSAAPVESSHVSSVQQKQRHVNIPHMTCDIQKIPRR